MHNVRKCKVGRLQPRRAHQPHDARLRSTCTPSSLVEPGGHAPAAEEGAAGGGWSGSISEQQGGDQSSRLSPLTLSRV